MEKRDHNKKGFLYLYSFCMLNQCMLLFELNDTLHHLSLLHLIFQEAAKRLESNGELLNNLICLRVY